MFHESALILIGPLFYCKFPGKRGIFIAVVDIKICRRAKNFSRGQKKLSEGPGISPIWEFSKNLNFLTALLVSCMGYLLAIDLNLISFLYLIFTQ
jgi:hypothetical protein